MDWLRPAEQFLHRRGVGCACAATAGTCATIWAVAEALGTFTRVEGVEPTNQAAERARRPAVLRRQRWFGKHREAGGQYGSRLLSVVQPLKVQGGSVLEYLQQALEAQRHDLPTPKLFPTN